jgi:hypothetical protein
MITVFFLQLRSADRQALHLVLRDLSDGQTSIQTQTQTQTRTSSVSNQQPSSHSQPRGQHHQHQHQHHGQPVVRIGIGAPPHPNVPFGLPQAPGPTGDLTGTQPPPGFTSPLHWQHHVQMMARLGLANQNQNPSINPIAHHGMQNRGNPMSTTPGRTRSPFQPETTRTIVREGISPDGQRWRVTVNESVVTTAERPGRTASPLSSAEVPTPIGLQPRSVPSAGSIGGSDFQSIFRAADAGPATRAIADAMRRNASSSSLANLASHQGQQPIPPGVTTPLIPSRTGSVSGTPDPLRANGRPINASAAAPEVYILSSPSGPRAVLFNGNLGTYSSPQLRVHQPIGLPFPPISHTTSSGSTLHTRQGVPPQIIQRSSMAVGNAPNNLNNTPPIQQPQVQPQHGLQLPPPVQPQFGLGMDNPQIQAIRIAQVWPHIWLMIRLALFIWWFTTPTSSWTRWITVISIAIGLFIGNTGLMNPVAEHVWVPLRRHLENLIPLAAGNAGARAAENAQGGGGNVANPARARDPDPTDSAARLVQQRRQDNANWLLDQVRRLERAGILFLASLAPGLAERHIAQVEAEAQAGRQRQQEAEAAATAAAQTVSEDATTSREASEAPSTSEIPGHEARSAGGESEQNANTPALPT